MTTICAVQGRGWVVIGWDSRVVDEDSRAYVAGGAWSKVVENNGYLLGAAGDVRAINILAHAFSPPAAPKVRGVRLDRFITAKFIPALREVFEREGYLANRRETAEAHGASLIVVVNKTVYEIGSDWAWVHPADGVYAIGSGAPFALGALSVLPHRVVTDAESAVMDALLMASRFDAGTGAPFKVNRV